MTLSARSIAAWQASSPPLTVMPAHELYAVALIPPAPGPEPLNTRAFKYMFARRASTAPRVMRPPVVALDDNGKSDRTASTSDSMNLNVESRVCRGHSLSSVEVAIG